LVTSKGEALPIPLWPPLWRGFYLTYRDPAHARCAGKILTNMIAAASIDPLKDCSCHRESRSLCSIAGEPNACDETIDLQLSLCRILCTCGLP
jgi:hypothetical protein